MLPWCWRPRILLFYCFAIFNLKWLLLFLHTPSQVSQHGNKREGVILLRHSVSAYMPFISPSHMVILSFKGGRAAMCFPKTSITAEEDRYQGLRSICTTVSNRKGFTFGMLIFFLTLLCEEKFSIEIIKLLDPWERIHLSYCI